LAEFIDQGHFTTHIRRLRQAYAQRRTLLLAVLEKNLQGRVQQIVVDAGLHFMIRLPTDIDDVALAAQCQSQGLSVRPLSRYYIGSTDVRGLVVGFAYVDTHDLVDCGQRLGAVIKSVLDGR
jgi:GntR family transcriptional regulator/MocR family aminotransferase